MPFYDRLHSSIKKQNSLLCVGLDPAMDKIPPHVKQDPLPLFAFNKAIIDATHEYVCAYKPNSAYYEAGGAQGIEELKMTCDYLKSQYPEIIVILDAKRGDIGHTNEGYVKYAFDYLQADAITLQPYLGKEANKPFLDLKEKGCIFLCRTSNPGSGEFQEKELDGKPLYLHIASSIYTEWNGNNNCMLVVGATYPAELAQVRSVVGDMPILVPGVGTQGGDLESTLKAGLTQQKDGLIITVSRSVLYASGAEDFADKARTEASCIYDMIKEFRQ